MIGYRFTKFIPTLDQAAADFDKLFTVLRQLLTYTSGDVSEALEWLTELDKQYKLSDNAYCMGDFIRDLMEKGYLQQENPKSDVLKMTSKMEKTIRQKSLEEIFGKMKKSRRGNHKSNFGGTGDEPTGDIRPYQFGDKPEQILMTESLRNAQINNSSEEFLLHESDLEVMEQEYQAQTSTVLMIDISHSMILYGEDRITPAKKVAMALSELIMTRYPKDTLDVIVFGNDAWQIQVKDLPYLQVGPYHTNTVAGLELAMDILRRRKNSNKHIFMITDGKPTCLREGLTYYKNSFGLDRKIVNKCYNYAAQCRRLNMPITTFMIAKDPYLQQYVQEFTEINKGKAFYTSLDGLGDFIFEDYERNKKRRVR
jgi:Ca-activated chloride channel family protein